MTGVDVKIAHLMPCRGPRAVGIQIKIQGVMLEEYGKNPVEYRMPLMESAPPAHPRSLNNIGPGCQTQ